MIDMPLIVMSKYSSLHLEEMHLISQEESRAASTYPAIVISLSTDPAIVILLKFHGNSNAVKYYLNILRIYRFIKIALLCLLFFQIHFC